MEFLLKTDSGFPKDTGVNLLNMATPGNPPLTVYRTVRASFLDGMELGKGEVVGG